MTFKCHSLIIFVSCILLLKIPLSLAYDIKNSLNTFGVPGLIDIPTAGSLDDGEMSISVSKFGSNLRNTISFQALPNVFGSFRYSGVGDRETGFYKTSGYTTWDRSFDLRVDLLKEKKLIPNLSVGVQDFIGTGIYSSEYVVISKSIYNSVQTTFGLGWGRLGSTNKIKLAPRKSSRHSKGGNINFNQFFTGDVGIFAGIKTKTPIHNLTLKAEVSSDDYSMDGNLQKSLPISNTNFGAEYSVNNALTISSHYIHKEKIGIQATFSANPHKTYSGNFIEPIPQPFYSLPYENKNNNQSYWNEVINELSKERINTIAYKTDNDTAIIVIQNAHYSSHTQAVGRTLRILSRYIPLSYKKFNIILSEFGVPITEISLDRNEVSWIVDSPNAELITQKLSKIKTARNYYYDLKINKKEFPTYYLRLNPYYRVHLFDPDTPLYYDFGGSLRFVNSLNPGKIVVADLRFPVLSTFESISRGVKGKMPKVRTNLKNYLNVNEPRIHNFFISSYYKPTSSLYGRITIGYLETMYAGISSELLFAPSEKKISFGAEVNAIEAREFRQLLNTRKLNGLQKVNGHLSAYWDTDYYDYFAQFDIGRYLAGDKGGTLTLSRNFQNGWQVGGYFTLTDASFDDFGEGSFDKGFFFKIPLNAYVPYETRSSFKENIRPIQGDGGARLSVPGRLNEVVSEYKTNRINSTWSRIWR